MAADKNASKNESATRDNSSNQADNPAADIVVTEQVDSAIKRAMAYLSVGRAVNLAGPAGVGKTTLAFHLAAQLEHPVSLMHGDDGYEGADLVGRHNGYKRRTRVDNYVHSVHKQDEDVSLNWIDNALTKACRHGHTLIYDEFTRSKPQANNALLSVLSEGLLTMPASNGVGEYLEVHPDFRVIFTSNPEEYAGVHSTQDALLDRMITIRLDHYGRETELEVASGQTTLDRELVGRVVDIVRATRTSLGSTHAPSLRATIAICRVVEQLGCRVDADDQNFIEVCCDVLTAPSALGRDNLDRHKQVREVVASVAGAKAPEPTPALTEPVATAQETSSVIEEPAPSVAELTDTIVEPLETVAEPIAAEAEDLDTLEESTVEIASELSTEAQDFLAESGTPSYDPLEAVADTSNEDLLTSTLDLSAQAIKHTPNDPAPTRRRPDPLSV